MSHHLHLSLDIRGAIQNGQGWKAVSSPDGRKVTKAEAIAYFLDRLAEGKRVLPMGPCEGFSFQTGCPGHEDEKLTLADADAALGIPSLQDLDDRDGGDR